MELIEAFLITLGLDPSGVKKGAAEAEATMDRVGDTAEKTQDRIDKAGKKTEDEAKRRAKEEEKRRKEAEAANKKLEESYLKVRDAVLGITAAVVEAVAGKELVHYLNENDTAAGKLATNIGSATQEVVALQTAFKRAGASGEDAGATLRTITKIREQIKNTGTFDGIYGFQRAGFDIGAFNSAKSDKDRLALMAAAIKKMSPQDAQFWGQQAGFGEEAIGVLIRQGAAIRELIDDSARLNKFTEEDLKATGARVEAYGRLQATFEGLSRQIVTEVSPAMNGAANGATAFLEYLEGHLPVANGLAVTLGATFISLNAVSLAALIAKVGALTGGLNAAGLASTKLLGVMSRLGMVVGVAGIADAALTALDPNDTLGAWIDAKIPGASELDNAFSYIGLGRSYAEQAKHDPYVTHDTSGGGAAAAASGQWEPLIQSAAAKWGVPADLIRAVMQKESSGNPNAIGPTTRYGNAQGLMQLIPGTSASLGITNPFDPAQNIDGGAHYLHDLLAKYGGNVQMALAAYNWGPGSLDKFGLGGAPAETRNYIASILGNMGPARSGGGSSVSINVGDVHVATTADTMSGMGRDVAKEILKMHSLSNQSNTSLQ